MKKRTALDLTRELIGLLAKKEDSKGWADHGGPGDGLVDRIMNRINTVETGYMQNITDEERVEQIDKAFRLNMFAVAVDCWKELMMLTGNDYENLRRWYINFVIAAHISGNDLNGIQSFIVFPANIPTKPDDQFELKAPALQLGMQTLKGSFASMTRESNAPETKNRAFKILLRTLKANPALQFTFLKETLVPEVFAKIEAGESPVVRFGIMKAIFTQLMNGEEPVGDVLNDKPTSSDKERFADNVLLERALYIQFTDEEINGVPTPRSTALDEQKANIDYILAQLKPKPSVVGEIKSLIHHSVHQRELASMFANPPQMAALDSLDPIKRGIALSIIIEQKLGLKPIYTNPFHGLGNSPENALSWDVPDSSKSIYSHPEREKEMSLDNQSPKPTLETKEALNDKVPELLEKIVGILSSMNKPANHSMVNSTYLGQPTQLNSNVMLGGMPLPEGVVELLKAKLTNNVQQAYGINMNDPQINSLIGDLVNSWDNSAAIGIAYPSSTGQPVNYITQPQSSPSTPYSQNSAGNQAKAVIVKVSNTQEIELSNGTKFVITHDDVTKLLTITHQTCNGNYGQLAVSGTYSDKDADYIVASLIEGIEAGSPFRAVQLAVQKLTPPTLGYSVPSTF